MIKIIETELMILRPLTLNDDKDVFEWVGDPIVNQFMPYPVYENLDQVKQWISSLPEDRNEFGFCLKSSNKVIGAGSIKYNSKRNAYEIGYNLNRSFWGQGYATEASKALIQWAYQELGARDFCATHATSNDASGNVLKKCGFEFSHYGQYSRFDGSETFDATFYVMHLD